MCLSLALQEVSVGLLKAMAYLGVGLWVYFPASELRLRDVALFCSPPYIFKKKKKTPHLGIESETRILASCSPQPVFTELFSHRPTPPPVQARTLLSK